MLVLRDALTTLLSAEDDIEIVGATEHGDRVLGLIEESSPDIVVLDIDLPGVDGLMLARQIGAVTADVRVLVLSAMDRPGIVREALDAGVRAFLKKGVSVDTLIDAIRRVDVGDLVISPSLLADALENGQTPLTEREQAVLQRVAIGKTAEDISRELHMAVGTTRNHMTQILRKLNVRNRIEAIQRAREAGWLWRS
ncbi:response regulator transcription factor [Pseudonocardia sp. ICBG601]|uniref:response regulator n=1 Tax=Pseudonocardia sp. ICBG601 TaxID=2846759 RepID=UPI0021F6775F|nr:response regulator transcription factor [Pseudonocardia sp. ICBG601]